MDISSFTSASTLPKKIITDTELIKNVMDHIIQPVHVQFNITNACPLQCSFCSCKNRDRSLSMSKERFEDMVYMFKSMGCKAITLTGGGDPLAHPLIDEFIEILNLNGIKTGLVTNAVLSDRLSSYSIGYLSWCRISLSDERNLDEKSVNNMLGSAGKSFSYVVSDEPNLKNITDMLVYAIQHDFTHVRIVDDILYPINHPHSHAFQPAMDVIKSHIKSRGIKDDIVIYQGRKNYTKGHKRCLISLLKPNIDPEGNMLPCCGAQFSQEEPSYDFTKDFIMNNEYSIESVYRRRAYFDGSVCSRCYYSDYNEVLNMLWDSWSLDHKDFI